jgi:hypothetical protein
MGLISNGLNLKAFYMNINWSTTNVVKFVTNHVTILAIYRNVTADTMSATSLSLCQPSISSYNQLEDQVLLSASNLFANIPYQPKDISPLPVQIINGKSRFFQATWFEKFP